MATFDEFRSRFPSLREASDEEIMSRVVRLTGLPPEQVARDFGYKLPESDFGRSMRAGWERYKGTFGHVGGALGFESAGEYGRRQDEAADFLSSTSAAPHTTEEIEFGHPDKGVLNWMGRQFAESLPYMGEVALATLVPETAPALAAARAARAARIGNAGVRALTRRGLTQEAAEQAVTRGMARGVQGAAASYPSSVGTILSEQQQQAGEYDPASAGALGVPHAALNMFGLEGAFARRSILRNVPETRGALGVLERGARGALRTGVGEGTAEVAQGELERVGRYAVDPSVEFVGPQADFERRESFLGGFAVGGALGGAGATVQRRSLLSNANPEVRPADQAGTPPMGEPQPQQLTLPGLEPGGPVQQDEEQAPPPTPAITPPGQMTLPGMESAQPPVQQQQTPEAGTEAPDLDAERDLVLEKYGRPEAVELGDGRSAVRWRGKTYYNQEAFIADVDKLVKAERGKQGMIVPLELAWARAMRTAAQRNEASTGNPQRVNITPGTFRSGDFVNLTGGATTVDEVIARTRHALAEAEPTEDGKGDFKRRRLLAAFLEELTGEPTPEPQPRPTEAPTAAIAPPTQTAARTETAAPPAPTAAPAQESAPAPAPRAGAKRAPAADTTPVELSDSIIAAAEAIVERAANATTQQRLTVTGIRDELQIKHKEARALVAELVKRGLIQKDDRGRLTPAAAVGSRAAGDVTITDAQGNQRVVDARTGKEKARRVVRAEKPAEKPPVEEKPAEKPPVEEKPAEKPPVEEKPAEKPEKVVRRKRRVVPTQPARAATGLGGEAAPRQRAELDEDSRNFAPIDEDIDTEQESAITAEDLAGMTVVDERGEEVDAGDLDLADDSDGDTTLDASEADLEEYRLDTSDMADDEDRGTKRSVGGVSSAGGSQGAVADKALRTTRAVELADRADELEQLAERQEARDQGRGGRFAKAAATAREKARKLREQAEKLLQEEAEHQRKLAEKRRKAEQKSKPKVEREPSEIEEEASGEVADPATGETVLERAKRIWDEAEFPGKPTFDELEPAARDRWIESVRNGHESLRDMDAALTPPSYSHGSDTNLIARLWQGVRITARHGSLEDLTDRNGGITEAISILDRLGLSRIFRRVDEIQVFTSVEGPGPQGFFQRHPGGKGSIGLNADLTTTGQSLDNALMTVLHETAHAIDMLLPSNWGERMSTAGVFSQDPRMKFRSGWRSAVPIGEVAKEVFEFWRLTHLYQDKVANTPNGKGGVHPSLPTPHRKLADELNYPLDQRWGLHDNPSVLQQEVFAQLFALYLYAPNLVALHLPKSAAFIKESIGEAKAQLQDQFGSQAQENSPGGPALPWRRHKSARAGQEVQADGRGNRRGEAVSRAGRTVNLSASASSLAGLPRGSLTMSDIEALLPKGEAAKPKGAANAKTRAQAAHDFLDQIPKASANPLRRIWDNLSNAAKKGMLSAAITEDLADMAAKFIPAVRDYVNAEKARLTIQTRHEAVVERILEQYDKLPQRERGTGAGTVNDFIYRSTTSGQWGYDPDAGNPNIAEDDRVKVNPEMAERFNKLSPAGQKLVRDVFQYGRDMLAAKKAAVRSVIDAEYDERLREAQTDEERQAIESERIFTHTNYDTLMRIQEVGPYAPLKRFGDYVVVARSQKYIEAGDQERAHLQSDAQHYSVHFAETFGEAKELAKRLEPFYAGGKVSAHAKEIARDTIYGATNELYTAFGQIRQLLKRTYAAEDELGTSETEKAALKKMSAMLSDLYLSSLSEASARTAELQRRNIAGADKDMMRALATQGRADAHFIATLSTFQATNEAMLAMKAQARESDDRATATRYLNEFLQRYADSMIYKPHRLENAIKRATSIWMLSTSPAYYFQQLTQTFMMSAPYMAGRHGYFRTLRTLQQAYHDVFEVVKAARVQERLDFSKLPADVRDAIQTLVARGKIDIGMDFDLGAWAVRGSSGFSAAWNRADGALRQFNEKIEGINRATAAIAAYRMERARGASHEAATNYAEKVVHVTHGSYDGFNTPRLLSTAFPGARVITQFRRFQIIQISMIARLFHNSMRGESPETRLAARRGLAFTLAHAATMGGVMGLPIAAPVAFLAKVLFGDDDEPYDLELALRRAVGHGPMAELLARGVPAWMGVDVSGRIGMGQMLSILPFFDKSPTSRQGMESMIVSAAGPFIGGLLPRAGNGAELMLKGQYYKGLEQFLPSGLANAMRGARFATEGVTTRAGERLMSSEELGYADVVFQALGLPTTKLTERQWRQNVMFETTEFYKDRQTEIRQRYVRAYNRNDVSEMSSLRREWMELQAGKARNGLKRQPLSDLLKAPREAAKRERQVIGGVQTTRSTAGLARELSGAR